MTTQRDADSRQLLYIRVCNVYLCIFSGVYVCLPTDETDPGDATDGVEPTFYEASTRSYTGGRLEGRSSTEALSARAALMTSERAQTSARLELLLD